MTDYHLKMKNYTTSLINVGDFITDRGIILFVPKGLSKEFDYIFMNVTLKVDHFLFKYVNLMLLSQESKT